MYKTVQQYNELFLTPFLQKQNQQSTNDKQKILKDIQNRSIQQNSLQINQKINSSDVDSNLSNSSHISLDQSTDKNDINQKKTTNNMNQLTEHILNNKYPRPIILLERVCFEK
ncbi:unnamed protein product [Rotaria sp. Silwood2]|nr:unnamed protein product [Rotaria sp. Silwood2]CAF3059485.1 unnamed protein product [Rotaria sp. Silwood2]